MRSLLLRYSTLIMALCLASSCATYRIRTESLPTLPKGSERFAGKSIAVLPAEVSFGASRVAIDLRDVRVTVNGQAVQLQTRYIAKDKDMNLGEIGILDVDILTKARVDRNQIGAYGQDLLASGLKGEHDYFVGFFKGLGEDNMGNLSNRPVSFDRSVYPAKEVYSDGSGPKTLFSSVKALAPGESTEGFDFILKTDFSLSSEVLEVLGVPSSTMPLSVGDRPPQQGDYFLYLLGSYRFSLIDAKTGEVIVSEKTKSEWGSGSMIQRYVRISASKGDADSYAKYFRTVDLSPYARDAARTAFESILPILSPFYVNTYHSEKVEK